VGEQLIDFSVTAKAKYADKFRSAFHKMQAKVMEEYVDDEKTAIKFRVTCEIGKISIMEKDVPLKAYAGVAYTSPLE
jgi:hypothetical protein